MLTLSGGSRLPSDGNIGLWPDQGVSGFLSANRPDSLTIIEEIIMTNLYVFGSGDCGQMGMGEDVDMVKRPTLHPYFVDKSIVAVAAGGMHTLALSSNGTVACEYFLSLSKLFRSIRGVVMMKRH